MSSLETVSTRGQATGEALTLPTDFEILDVLSDGLRQTPRNVAAMLNRNTGYIADRLRDLRNKCYVRNPGPADNSGMYEITNLGLVVNEHSDVYVRDHHSTFDRLSRRILANQPSDADDLVLDLVGLTQIEYYCLHALTEETSPIIPSQVSLEEVGCPRSITKHNLSTVGPLYATAYFGLSSRHGADAYELSVLGRVYIDQCGPEEIISRSELERQVFQQKEGQKPEQRPESLSQK